MAGRPIELAMTHRIGASGQVERCLRPKQVLDTADRMRKWAGTPETCQGCQTRHAISIRGGASLCGLCREQRTIRTGFDPVGRRAYVERQDDDTDALQLRGLAIVFNSPSVDMGFTEYIRPSAADRTASEGIDVRALWSHNADFTIGRISAGTLRAQKVSRGVSVEIDPPKWGAQYVESVARRDITGMSFAFETWEDDWHMENGEPVREVLDMRYFEVSGVSFPAYPATTLAAVRADQRSAWIREQETLERVRLAR